MQQHEGSEFLHHEPCPACGSKDNLGRFSDGHGYCFGCGHYEKGDGEVSERKGKRMSADLITGGEFKALVKRNISEETCKHFGYRVSEFKGKTVQVAPYKNADGEVVAQKLRFPNKDFVMLGNAKASLPLWGQWLWRDTGKMVVITEGEIDAMSVSQLQGNKWPVVSVKNGAQGAKKNVQQALDWLEAFETVVFFFDMDEPGQEAARECALLLTPGKAKIASLPAPFKDANDALKAGQGKLVIDAIWGAKTYRPDGIVSGADLWDKIIANDDAYCVPLPWQGLQEKTLGLRKGELITVTAGSGIGKSAICRELAHHLHALGETIGYIALEEPTKRTALGIMGIEVNRPLHISRAGMSEQELRAAFEATVGSGRFYLYDHFGSTEIDNLISRIRYLAKGVGCGWIFLDHVSIVVSGQEEGDERRLIDNLMTRLRTLVQETGVGMILVSHLKRPEGNKGHEQGAVTSLAQLRGSHAIAQLSDGVWGAERDQQGENPNITLLRVLKNRFSGDTGPACYLRYDRETGRLHETDPNFTDETKDAEDFMDRDLVGDPAF
jgi:twinkle protein